MNEQPNPKKSPRQKKKRSFWWLKLLLILILLAAGVIGGMLLSSEGITEQLIERFFPQYAVSSTENNSPLEIPAPTPTAEADKPIVFTPAVTATPAPKPSKAPLQIVSPEAEEKAEEEPAVSEEPEASPEPETAAVFNPIAPTEEPVESSPAPVKEYIGVDAALEAALKHAGLEAKDVFVYGVSREKEDGFVYYELEFEYNGREYEYEINAYTGAVESWKAQRDGAVKTEASAAKSEESAYISMEEAKAAALEHAGIKEQDAGVITIDLEIERNKPVYDVEFRANGYDYDYKIDAQSGQVIMVEKERD